MKSRYLILILVLLCTGCSSIKYNIKFGESIHEEISANVNSSVDIGENADFYISPFQSFFGVSSYDIIWLENGSNISTNYFYDINDYLNNSIIFQKVIAKEDIIIQKNKVKINIKGLNYLNLIENIDDSLEISLYIPYYVSSHNADSVINNTYVWEINDIENSHIMINFDMSKSYKHKSSLSTIIVISIFSVIIVATIIYFVKKNKEVNEI